MKPKIACGEDMMNGLKCTESFPCDVCVSKIALKYTLLIEAIEKVLEWYDEDASDNVHRRAAIEELREQYEKTAS